MNLLFVTYCSGNKSDAKGLLPSIKRYNSERIRRIFHAARKLGIEYRTLSGRYGLISPEDEIPYYDYLLEQSRTTFLSKIVARQLIELGTSKLIYFSKDTDEEPELARYKLTIKKACLFAGVELIEQPLETIDNIKCL